MVLDTNRANPSRNDDAFAARHTIADEIERNSAKYSIANSDTNAVPVLNCSGVPLSRQSVFEVRRRRLRRLLHQLLREVRIDHVLLQHPLRIEK